jgi:hypothetical protein
MTASRAKLLARQFEGRNANLQSLVTAILMGRKEACLSQLRRERAAERLAN